MGKKLSAYNLHMKRELKGKLSGKTKAQRAKVFKDAVRAWNAKKKGKSKPRPKPKSGGSSRSSSTTRRSNTTMGKRGSFNTQKLFKLVRLGALAMPAAGFLMSAEQPATKINRLKKAYFGVDANGQFNLGYLAEGWLPYLASIGVTYGIPKLTGLLRGI